MRHWIKASLIGAVLAMPLTGAAQAQSNSVADFYRGKTINMIVGYSAGGGYDIYARLIAPYLTKHLPGNPSVVVQNMDGAGSLKATNYLYNVAPKDGTAIGTFGRGLAMEPLIGGAGTQFDATKFTWLASGTNELGVFVVWHTSPIKTWDDMLTKEFTVGGEGSGSDPDIYAALLKNLFGVKLKLISGYPGTSEVTLALERGEVDGRASWSWSSLKSTKSNWINDKLVRFPVQLGTVRNPDLPDVPTILDFAKTEKQQQIVKLILSRQVMGRPFAAPPGVPEDRKQALRKAFDDSFKDPEFLAEAKKRKMDVNPVSGADIEKLVAEVYATPPEIVKEARTVITGGK
jgi:tripartite-type tricarboxylate transporter receptor subunit TctC